MPLPHLAYLGARDPNSPLGIVILAVFGVLFIIGTLLATFWLGPQARRRALAQIPDEDVGTLKSGHPAAASDSDVAADDTDAFLANAREAFLIIRNAVAEGDVMRAETYLSPTLFQTLRLEAPPAQDHVTSFRIDSAHVINVHRDGGKDVVNVWFDFTERSWRRDHHSGAAEGHAKSKTSTEYWRFERTHRDGAVPANQNHTAVGVMAKRCPNCGAPLDLNAITECPNCHAAVTDAEFTWLVTSVSAE